jgi:ankyrin repeat protein
LKTPLIYAASGGSFEVVKQIIAAGADINAIDDEGWSPLIHVAHRGNWNLDVAAYLLKIGANPNQITKNDRVSAIRRALENRDEKMAIMLMEYPIDINHMFYVSERLLVEVLANPSYAPFINKHLNDLNEENVLKWKKCRVRALYK